MLPALLGHPAALQRVLLGSIPVPGPALELTEVIQQEWERRLVAALKCLPVLVGQSEPRLAELVAPFEDESSDQSGTEQQHARDRLVLHRGIKQFGPVEQLRPGPVAVEELEGGDAGERVRYLVRIAGALSRMQGVLRTLQGSREIPGHHPG